MNAILWPDSQKNKPPANFKRRLREKLRGRVSKAYLFGSFESDAFHSGSDIDLILVAETNAPFIERASQFNDLYNLYPQLDILVYTSTELESLLKENIGFWASVKETLRELPLDAKSSTD